MPSANRICKGPCGASIDSRIIHKSGYCTACWRAYRKRLQAKIRARAPKQKQRWSIDLERGAPDGCTGKWWCWIVKLNGKEHARGWVGTQAEARRVARMTRDRLKSFRNRVHDWCGVK